MVKGILKSKKVKLLIEVEGFIRETSRGNYKLFFKDLSNAKKFEVEF